MSKPPLPPKPSWAIPVDVPPERVEIERTYYPTTYSNPIVEHIPTYKQIPTKKQTHLFDFTQLPPEIQRKIGSNLPALDALNLRKTSKLGKTIGNLGTYLPLIPTTKIFRERLKKDLSDSIFENRDAGLTIFDDIVDNTPFPSDDNLIALCIGNPKNSVSPKGVDCLEKLREVAVWALKTFHKLNAYAAEDIYIKTGILHLSLGRYTMWASTANWELNIDPENLLTISDNPVWNNLSKNFLRTIFFALLYTLYIICIFKSLPEMAHWLFESFTNNPSLIRFTNFLGNRWLQYSPLHTNIFSGYFPWDENTKIQRRDQFKQIFNPEMFLNPVKRNITLGKYIEMIEDHTTI